MVKIKLYTWILALLFVAASISVIFYPQLQSEAPLADLLGQEYAVELIMLIGISFMAYREANGDYELENNQLPVNHAWSFFQRVVIIGFSMILLNYTVNMDFLTFVWNLSMYGAIYSLVFNARLSWNRGKYIIEYISGKGKSVYDRMFYFIGFKNGYAAGVIKIILEGSALPALLMLKHFAV